jgi:hypothetical protein
MHPPCFSFEQSLSDRPACILELTCCKGTIQMPVRLLLRKHGDRTFNDLFRTLRCEDCGGHPAPVYTLRLAFSAREQPRRDGGLGGRAGWPAQVRSELVRRGFDEQPTMPRYFAHNSQKGKVQ